MSTYVPTFVTSEVAVQGCFSKKRVAGNEACSGNTIFGGLLIAYKTWHSVEAIAAESLCETVIFVVVEDVDVVNEGTIDA